MFSWRLQIETTIAIQPKIWEKMSICDCLDLTKLNIHISKRLLVSVLSLTPLLFMMQLCCNILSRPTFHTPYASF